VIAGVWIGALRQKPKVSEQVAPACAEFHEGAVC
jgi:hypothetical protein